MKAIVILENAPDCELDRATVECEGDDEDALSAAIWTHLATWTLHVGDTIKIAKAPYIANS